VNYIETQSGTRYTVGENGVTKITTKGGNYIVHKAKGIQITVSQDHVVDFG
jgi:hypothetical protein